MAIERMTSGVMRFLMDRAAQNNGEAIDYIDRAKQVAKQGNTQEAQNLLQQASSTFQKSDTDKMHAQEVEQNLKAEMLEVLKKYGIQEDPPVEILGVPSYESEEVSFYDNVPKNNDDVEWGNPLNNEGGSYDAETGELKRELKKMNVTPVQYQAIRAKLRLSNDPDRESASMRDIVLEIMTPEEINEIGGMPVVIANRMIGNWNGSANKLVRGFEYLGGAEATVPFTDEQLERMKDIPLTQEIYRRINQVEVYQGLTIGQIIHMTEDAGRKSMVLRRIEKDNKKPSDVLGDDELKFLVYNLLQKNDLQLADHDSEYLSELLRDWQVDYEIGADAELAQSILDKMQRFGSMDEEHRNGFFEAQTENGQLIFAIVSAAFNEQEKLQNFLGISPSTSQ